MTPNALNRDDTVHGTYYYLASEADKIIDELKAERDALRADAESYRWIVKHAGWYRNDEDDFRDNWTKLAINVAYGADLSCEAMRRLAIENAMKGKS